MEVSPLATVLRYKKEDKLPMAIKPKNPVLSKYFLFMCAEAKVVIAKAKLGLFILSCWINRLKRRISYLKCTIGKTSHSCNWLQEKCNYYKEVENNKKRVPVFFLAPVFSLGRIRENQINTMDYLKNRPVGLGELVDSSFE